MAQGHTPVISGEAVREALGRILASHEFRSSKRSQDFLRYVVDRTLSGEVDILKERTIGIEVFGRPTSYDPSEDATVRVKAGEVRKRLGLYYAAEGLHDRLRIELPAGTYVPEFRWSETEPVAAETAPVPIVTPLPPAPAPAAKSPRWIVVGLAAVAVIAVGFAAFFWLRPRPAESVLLQFWSPVLEGAYPVSLCAAFVPVWGLERAPDAKGATRPDDYVKLTDEYVGGGDLIAVSRLSAMLTRMRRPYRVRIGNDVSFHDLRTSPAILVGYSYSRWKEISSQLRFFIDINRRPLVITDNGAPTKWSLPNLTRDRHSDEDYAIVTRVFHPDTHAMLVELTGILQYGTDAAADLVTNADLLSEALRAAPPGWQQKNLQLVLHVKVIGGAPTSPRVVGTYFW